MAQPPAPPRRFYGRLWFWALVILGAPFVAYGLFVFSVLVQVGPEDDHAMYEEDFSTGAGKFEIWEEPEGGAAVVDGAYVMTDRYIDRSLWVGVDAPWTAARMRIDAQMQLTQAGDQHRFGLYLRRTDGEMYIFMVSPEGAAWITGPDLVCQTDSPLGNVRGGEIALSGKHGWPPGGNETTLEGYLNGRVVVTCVDENFDSNGTGVFDGAGLWLFAAEEPATVRVDDVVVNSYAY